MLRERTVQNESQKRVSDEEILNVFRSPETDDTLSTTEIANSLPIKRAGTLERLKQLREEGRVVLVSEGRPYRWKLDEDEPEEPIYDPQIATAKRWANSYATTGRIFVIYGFGLLALSGFLLTLALYAQIENIHIPLVSHPWYETFALTTGPVGLLVLFVGSITILISYLLPRLVEWMIERDIVL